MLLEVSDELADVVGVDQFEDGVFGGKILFLLSQLHVANIKEY